MYLTPDGESVFVVDGHIHLWDARAENRRNRHGLSFIECFWGSHSALTPDGHKWSYEDFLHYGVERAIRDLFVNGYCDQLDPHMAAGEVNSGIRPVYRNPMFSSYVVLSTRDAFAENHPEALERVLKVYEKARHWMLENPEETVEIVAKASGQPADVIRQNLTRADFTMPIPDARHIDTIRETIPLLKSEGIVRPSVDLEAALDSLVDTSFAKRVVQQ